MVLWTLSDNQCPHAYAVYGDIAMETLLVMAKPVCEKYLNAFDTNLRLAEFMRRIYLPKHVDKSCDFSTIIRWRPMAIFIEVKK